jgi:putative DNA primase/helicase
MNTITNAEQTHNYLDENNGNAVAALPFQTKAEEDAELAPHQREIALAMKAIMSVCAELNVPDSCRNFIDALIGVSKGEIRVEASDYRIACQFYKDKVSRDALKKRVQRWREKLVEWQTQTGYTLVQISPGFKRGEQMTSSVYSLVILKLAAKVILSSNGDMPTVSASLLQEMKSLAPVIDTAPRRGTRTAESCRKAALTWARKAFETEIAEQGGDIQAIARELAVGFADLLDEYATKDGRGGTNPSHREKRWDELEDINSFSKSSSQCTNTDPAITLNKWKVVPTPDIAQGGRNVDIAVSHAELGLRVFPVYEIANGTCTCRARTQCHTPGKHPRIVGWINSATTDAAIIRQWWRQFPQANIGIVTGAASDIVVIDVDTKHDGEATLAEMEREHGQLPETLTARTGSGGRHIFFRHPGIPIRNIQADKTGVTKLGRGLDVRGDGGFIVAPGSIHMSSNTYEWIDVDIEIAEMPDWLLQLLSKKEKAPTASPMAVMQRPYFRPQYADSIIEGTRNETLFRYASGLRGGGADYLQLESALCNMNSRCVPPLTEIEVGQIAQNAMRFPTNAEKLGRG